MLILEHEFVILPQKACQAPGPPPSFEHAKNRRQKARSAGLDPNHWYAVDQSKRIRKGDRWHARAHVYVPDAVFLPAFFKPAMPSGRTFTFV